MSSELLTLSRNGGPSKRCLRRQHCPCRRRIFNTVGEKKEDIIASEAQRAKFRCPTSITSSRDLVASSRRLVDGPSEWDVDAPSRGHVGPSSVVYCDVTERNCVTMSRHHHNVALRHYDGSRCCCYSGIN
jgi:hypothetical protein